MRRDEFRPLALQVIDGFKARISHDGLSLLEYPLSGGELGLAIEDLVGVIVDEGVPVTITEREQLRGLLNYLEQPSNIVDQLRVEPGSVPGSEA